MSGNIQLPFELSEHPEKMSAEDIADILTGTTSALKYISQEISKTEGSENNWQVLNIGMKSPFQIIFTPSDTCSAELALETESEFFKDQYLISQKKTDLPDTFNREAIESLNKEYTAVKRIGKTARFVNIDYEIKTNLQLEKNLKELLKIYSKYEYFEWTTLTGKLQEVGGKSQTGRKHPYFNLRTSVYGKSVKCYFEDEEFEKFRANLELDPINVSVFGKVKFNNKGIPVNITQIKSWKIIKDIGNLLETKSDVEINITNGVNSVDHIDQVRHKF